MRSKIEFTDIAVYEVILDTELLKANFRRKIAGMVIETNEYTKDAGHRPSKLFKFDPNWKIGSE